jgi:hypothetical protein
MKWTISGHQWTLLSAWDFLKFARIKRYYLNSLINSVAYQTKKALQNFVKPFLIISGEYRSRTDDLLHAMQAL